MIKIPEKFAWHPISLVALVIFLVLLYKWVISRLHKKRKLAQPPSPPKLPILGNLHQLGKLPHRTLRKLSHKYGELMLLYLGSRPTLVVSSASAAAEIMKTHDLIFANRPKLKSANIIMYDGKDLIFDSYGPKWRYMKNICMMQLLSNTKVQSFRAIREQQVGLLVEKIKSNNGGSVLNMSHILFNLSKELVCRTAFGNKYAGNDEGSLIDFYQIFKEFIAVLGQPSVGDYIPFLGWIDRLTGLEGCARKVRRQFDEFIQGVIHQHQISMNHQVFEHHKDGNMKSNDVQDFVDVLLQVHQHNPEKLSTEDIKALILDMFVGAIETSSTTLEWAMTELIRHPKIMKKLQKEVRGVVVKTNKRRVSEDDLESMNYLKAVIKETLRVHIPSPLLVFRESSQNAKIDKYEIPARTQVIINAWAIQRDPKYWDNPEDFHPERFLNESARIDFRGHHFQYIPFGAGRRACPGMSYGIATLELVVASLVYDFNWTLSNGKEGCTLDVEERAGISVQRKNPLMLIATPYNNLNNSCF